MTKDVVSYLVWFALLIIVFADYFIGIRKTKKGYGIPLLSTTVTGINFAVMDIFYSHNEILWKRTCIYVLGLLLFIVLFMTAGYLIAVAKQKRLGFGQTESLPSFSKERIGILWFILIGSTVLSAAIIFI